ncbi:hypothetical protein B0H67DRAFT_508606 [Lasiosphaeris hirsuta]|uniref:Uncharacterized protein n=1 Tax=Lasiosphaeris hirsuta TaxID=260670 RepID=A0AA40E7U0_9PEZI|nr:hypothetical protein B0H67DRAFT_508606 [Lasiosphaeris hirsuta]
MAMSYSPQHPWGPSQFHRRQVGGNNTLECAPGGVKTLANCDKLDELLIRCDNLTEQQAPQQEIADCFCAQEMLNAYVGCKNDMRLCSLSYTFDADFDVMISNWNNACQPYFTRGVPTTPADIPLSETFNENSCQTLYVSCNKLQVTSSSCSSSHTQALAWTSCMCRSDILALASECEIDGAIQCEKTTPNPATLWGAIHCSQTATISSHNLAATTTSFIGGTIPTISFGPTASSTNSAGHMIAAPMSILVFLLAILPPVGWV